MSNIKKIVLITMIFTLSLFMVACKKDVKDSLSKTEETTEKYAKDEDTDISLYIASDNSVTATFVSSFDKYYYDKKELEEMIDKEIADFNENLAGDPLNGISKAGFEVKDKKVTLKIKFINYYDFNSYSRRYIDPDKELTMFVGDYDSSVAANISINSTIYLTSDDSAMNLEEIPTSGYGIFYINTNMDIEFEGEIVGVNENVTVDGNKVSTKEEADNYVIIK